MILYKVKKVNFTLLNWRERDRYKNNYPKKIFYKLKPF